MALTPEQRAARLEELRKAREEKAAQMAAERLTTRAAAIEKTAAEYYGVTPVKVGATTEERVEALKDIRAAENLATYSTASEFTPIPYAKLDPKIKGVMAANAASLGITPEEYYSSRGGVNASGYYGDSYTPGLTLTEREYQIARLEGGIGTTGAGAAINAASQKKTYDYYISQGDNPAQASIRSGYAGTSVQVKTGAGPLGGNLYFSDGKYYDDAGNEIDTNTGQSAWNSSTSAVSTINAGTTQLSTISTIPTAAFVGNTDFSTTSSTSGPTLARDTFKNTLALFYGAAEVSKPWVNALYDVVNKYYRTGSSADESFNLALQDARNNPLLKPYTDRFKGIYALQDMRQAGKPVLVPTIKDYVASQTKIGDLLTQVGMGNLATEEFTGDLIGKGNSVTTIANKISQVFTRIDLAPKAIKDTLSRYFPTVDRTTLARTLLLGEKGTQQLVDELAQYEVLAAAEQQNLGATQRTGGLTVERAAEYARLGETFETITPKFSQVALATPRVSQLAGFSGVQDIGQEGVEKAVISRSAKELKQLEELTKQEEGRFAGRAGRFASRDRAAGII